MSDFTETIQIVVNQSDGMHQQQSNLCSTEEMPLGVIRSHSTTELPSQSKPMISEEELSSDVDPSGCPERRNLRGAASRFSGRLARSVNISLESGNSDIRGSRDMFKSLVLHQIEQFYDPWEHHHIEKIPAERVRSYHYVSATQSWYLITFL